MKKKCPSAVKLSYLITKLLSTNTKLQQSFALHDRAPRVNYCTPRFNYREDKFKKKIPLLII